MPAETPRYLLRNSSRGLAVACGLALVLASCRSMPDWPAVPEAPEAPSDPLLEHRDAADSLRRQLVAGAVDLHGVVWYGRRLGYLGAYESAVETYTLGLDSFPGEPRLLRHRGHRLISLRRFEAAREDLRAARELLGDHPDEVEADGLPNAAGIPTSTLHGNVHYHLALAEYLLGDYEAAAASWRDCADLPMSTPDMQVAARSWWCLCLRRLGRSDEARQVASPVAAADLEILENHAYHWHCRLQAGEVDRAAVAEWAEAHPSPAIHYVLARWDADVSGDAAAAREQLERLATDGAPAAFGTLGAVQDL